MMIPPIYPIAAQDVAVQAALGGADPRLYPFGQDDDDQHRQYPYATWQVVPGGEPENYLAGRPDADHYLLQIDVWAQDAASGLAAAGALRDAIELHCHIVSWRGQNRDPQTKSYRVGFDAHWIVQRA